MSAAGSRYLTHLDRAISKAASPITKDCLRAERACYFARQGRVDSAKDEITVLRAKYAPAPNVAISAWLSLAEGLEGYFRHLAKGSRDKVLRAHALSAAASLHPLQALSAAWLAQMDFARLDVEGMARNVKEALRLAEPTDSLARTRASLVVAQSLHFAHRFDLASPWYRRAHVHAATVGDETATSALMNNMACMRLDNLRQARLTGLGTGDDARMVQGSVDSTGRFDDLFGSSSLVAINPLFRGKLHSLEGRPAEALDQYAEHMSIDTDGGFSRMHSELHSDVAWCKVQLGQSDAAVASAMEAERQLSPETQIDDRAATHTRLGWVYLATGDVGASQKHEALAAEAWDKCIQLQARIVELLAGVSDIG